MDLVGGLEPDNIPLNQEQSFHLFFPFLLLLPWWVKVKEDEGEGEGRRDLGEGKRREEMRIWEGWEIGDDNKYRMGEKYIERKRGEKGQTES